MKVVSLHSFEAAYILCDFLYAKLRTPFHIESQRRGQVDVCSTLVLHPETCKMVSPLLKEFRETMAAASQHAGFMERLAEQAAVAAAAVAAMATSDTLPSLN